MQAVQVLVSSVRNRMVDGIYILPRRHWIPGNCFCRLDKATKKVKKKNIPQTRKLQPKVKLQE